jgi:hypothetical protein
MKGLWAAICLVVIAVAISIGAFWPSLPPILFQIRASAPTSKTVSKAIGQAACRQATVDLARAVSFDWDEVAILTPYSSQQSADRALGFHWPGYWRYQDALDSEGEDVLVFLKSGQVSRVVVHARVRGDFDDRAVAHRHFPRSSATFAAERVGYGCRFIRLTPTA